MDPEDVVDPNVGVDEDRPLTLTEFRRAFHQVHELLELPDPLT